MAWYHVGISTCQQRKQNKVKLLIHSDQTLYYQICDYSSEVWLVWPLSFWTAQPFLLWPLSWNKVFSTTKLTTWPSQEISSLWDTQPQSGSSNHPPVKVNQITFHPRSDGPNSNWNLDAVSPRLKGWLAKPHDWLIRYERVNKQVYTCGLLRGSLESSLLFIVLWQK